ncbi:membrane protein [Tepidanaerobacter syntrophicus]|uniref:DUF1385 domain-containing protein n=1 Tax=Tepidanaerobacter syntrophicus TaxID=224999 RepID=UPI001770DFFF|nr:DUF1385 domain-containing protein [Tepidanaerobacter syntrophicus]GLI19492.1 membrane protein [Tepidanaerobacter syntrophicus]HHV83477.1 DUF1385 domain-containing protein [Tepidanaerobacter syntrophicus]
MKEVKPAIGGQAVIEGVMMRGPKSTAIAVRKDNGEIVLKKDENHSISERYKFLKLPILRGVVSLIEMMIIGIQTLSYSATMAGYEEEETLTAKDIAIALASAVVFAVVLFIILPTVAVKFISANIKTPFLLSLAEGFLRIAIFVAYVAVISLMKDIRRVFEYHGAEHKVVHCYEHGEDLTPENAKKYSTVHPRCGTSFIMIVMIVSILLFSILGWPGIIARIVSRILLLPVVAGISYELIQLAGRSSSPFLKILNTPGMWLQKLTTREPDDSQLEVAIAALKAVID